MWFLQWILGAVRALADQSEPARAVERARLVHAARLRVLWLHLSGVGLEGEQKRERAYDVQQLQRVLQTLGALLVAWEVLAGVIGRSPAAGQIAAVHLLGLALPTAGLVDRDLAAALGVGDLFVLRQRLPSLFAMLRGALDPVEAT